MKSAMIIVCLALACGNVAAGPFGLEFGMSLEEILAIDPSANTEGDGIYLLEVVPEPSQAFDFFLVQIHPEYGVYWIKAVGVSVFTSIYGTALKEEFERVEKGLSRDYGEPDESIDSLRAGSIWNEPQDWMIGIMAKDRRRLSIWGYHAELQGPAERIYLVAKVDTTTIGYVVVEYLADGYEVLDGSREAIEKP